MMPKFYHCYSCGKNTKPDSRRFITGPTYKEYRKYLGIVEINDETTLTPCTCLKCYSKFNRLCKVQHANISVHEGISDDPDYIPPEKTRKINQSPKSIALAISSTGRSHSACCICQKRDVKFFTLSADTRHSIFINTGTLLLSGTRCCPSHVTLDGKLNEDALNILIKHTKISQTTKFNKTEISDLIAKLRTIANRNEKKRLDFDATGKGCLNEADYLSLTGLKKADFDDLVSHVQNIRDTKNRSIRTCIAVLLVKMRTGMSNRVLSTVFNIEKTCIRRAIKVARAELDQYFIPKHLGFNHVTREEIIQNQTRPLAQELFGDVISKPAILILDGTYIYIQKSDNFKFQRSSYSQHKNRPLVKPMVIVSTSGYIISILGPYFANSKNNDANILKHTISNNMENIKQWIKEDDIFIVDRGFRDSIYFLENLGIKSEMPAFLQKGQKQHTVEEANSSRLVTKLRWVVESVNSRLKQWKYLQNVVPNSQIPFIGTYVRLVAALCNKYRPSLSVGQQDTDQSLAAKMKFLASQRNELQMRVSLEELHKNIKNWKKMDTECCLQNFPKISEEELRDLTVGIYQLKLAKAYTVEHLDDEGEYIISVNDDILDILRVRIQSRHVSSKSYLIWIEYSPISIRSWYCQCKAGARVVGACAHVSSVLWYLGFARHQADVLTSVHDWSQYLEDAAQNPQLIDSDSDESVVEE